MKLSESVSFMSTFVHIIIKLTAEYDNSIELIAFFIFNTEVFQTSGDDSWNIGALDEFLIDLSKLINFGPE